MLLEIKVPSMGESTTEALLAKWLKNDGDAIKKDDPLFVLETDKVEVEMAAEADGVLAIRAPAGETVEIGAVICTIETDVAVKGLQHRRLVKGKKQY